jgi:transposase-like protein
MAAMIPTPVTIIRTIVSFTCDKRSCVRRRIRLNSETSWRGILKANVLETRWCVEQQVYAGLNENNQNWTERVKEWRLERAECADEH